MPHPRHDDFINDPTHVRIITPSTLSLFDRRVNDEIKALKGANTRLAHYLDVDFFLESQELVLCEPYLTQHQKRQLSNADVELMSREWNNVASEYRIVIVARKSPPQPQFKNCIDPLLRSRGQPRKQPLRVFSTKPLL